MADASEQSVAVVTGGAGFVGSHLCERLRDEGYRVVSLDNYFTGSRENHVEGVEYREGHTKDIAQLVPETPDIIYHLGEYPRVLKSLDEPNVVWDLNTIGTLGVLEFWRTSGCKLVYAGSSTKRSKSRTDDIEGSNLAPYTWAKAANCSLVNNYARWFELPHAITYFYNVYGPRERSWENYGTLVETFKQNYLAGRPHKVSSPGTQTRAFTHVKDTVDGLVLVGERGHGDDYYIGSQDVYSLLAVAEMFGGDVEMQPPTKSSRSSGAEDTSKIEALGWRPQHSLAEYVSAITKGSEATNRKN